MRSVEDIARNINQAGDDQTSSLKTRRKLPEEFKILKEHLSKFFDAKVLLNYYANGKGKITIPFDSDEKLTKIMGMLDRIK